MGLCNGADPGLLCTQQAAPGFRINSSALKMTLSLLRFSQGAKTQTLVLK